MPGTRLIDVTKPEWIEHVQKSETQIVIDGKVLTLILMDDFLTISPSSGSYLTRLNPRKFFKLRQGIVYEPFENIPPIMKRVADGQSNLIARYSSVSSVLVGDG